MDTLKLDDTGDLCLCKKNNLAIYRDLNAVIQTCENYVKATLNEMILNYNNGVPYFQTVFNTNVNIPLFEDSIKNRLLEVDGVEKVLSVKAEVNNETLSYIAYIQTIYGNGVING
ncbi:hypothetical protein ACNSOP_09225 [Aliarcobacter lanthieri]|uniref:hypothetical protein n=1 Tax=Aliarcobacter lanthieri TaxID=1355374 RepID=UPI003AAC3321